MISSEPRDVTNGQQINQFRVENVFHRRKIHRGHICSTCLWPLPFLPFSSTNIATRCETNFLPATQLATDPRFRARWDHRQTKQTEFSPRKNCHSESNFFPPPSKWNSPGENFIKLIRTGTTDLNLLILRSYATIHCYPVSSLMLFGNFVPFNPLAFEKFAKCHRISDVLTRVSLLTRLRAFCAFLQPLRIPPPLSRHLAIFIRYFRLRNVITVCTAELSPTIWGSR